MTDQALKDSTGSAVTAPLSGSRAIMPTRFGEKVISFIPSRPEDEKGKADARPGASQPRDWSAAVDLVREASESIRISQERAEELEAQLHHVVAQATEEMQRLTAQIDLGEQKLGHAEERARAAEARATEAETWLARLNDAIFSAFTPSKAGSDASRPVYEAAGTASN